MSSKKSTLIEIILKGDRLCWDTFGECSIAGKHQTIKYIENIRNNEHLIILYIKKHFEVNKGEIYKDTSVLSFDTFNLLRSCIENETLFIYYLLGGLHCEEFKLAEMFYNKWIKEITNTRKNDENTVKKIQNDLINFCKILHNFKFQIVKRM